MLDSVLFSGTNKSPSPSSGTKTGFPWHVTVGSITPEGQGCLCRHQRDLLTTGSHSSRSHSSAEGPAATVPGPSCLGQGAQGSPVSWYACSRPFLQETCAHLGESCIPYDHLENWQRLRRLSMLIPKNPQSYHQGDGPQLHVQRLIKDALESS